MHIAICDDERKELLHLQALVRKYDANIELSLYPSAESLLDSIKKRRADIALLDIEMDGLNGFDAAKEIVGLPNPPLIVFVTNSGEYTYRGYEVAFRYLPKPVSYATLADVLAAATAKIAPHKFTIVVNGRTRVIPVSEIIYFESFGHLVVAHTKTDSFEIRMKLGEVESSLPGNAFASPHKGILVNLDHVDTVGDSELTLSGNVAIPVSRRRKQDFERALFRFVRRPP